MNRLAIAALAAGFGLSTHSAFADPMPAGSVRIIGVEYTGTGCPQGHADASISEDAQTLIVMFDQFVVDTAKDAAPNSHGWGPSANARKNCTLTVRMEAPEGYTYTFNQLDVYGYANLEKQTVGQLVTQFGFPNAFLPSTQLRYFPLGNHIIKGEYSGDFHKSDVVKGHMANGNAWGSCRRKGNGRETSVSIAIQMSILGGGIFNKNKAGMMAIDTVDGSVANRYGMTWSKCK